MSIWLLFHHVIKLWSHSGDHEKPTAPSAPEFPTQRHSRCQPEDLRPTLTMRGLDAGMAKDPIRSIEKILGDADALIRRRLKAAGLEVQHIVLAVRPDGLGIIRSNVAPGWRPHRNGRDAERHCRAGRSTAGG
jgi:hypothetical protein